MLEPQIRCAATPRLTYSARGHIIVVAHGSRGLTVETEEWKSWGTGGGRDPGMDDVH